MNTSEIRLRDNPYEKYFTRGQCLADYKYMLDKTIREIREQRPNDTLHILEPTAGSKSLVVEYPNVVWHLYDIDPLSDDITQADFLTYDFNRRYDLICCNPPFKYKKQFAQKCLSLSDNIIFISPKDCLPYYEYSIKRIYAVDFEARCLIGIWHYDKSKENKDKWKANIAARPALPEKITYAQYKSLPDPKEYYIFFFFFNIDYRSAVGCVNTTTEEPSLKDTISDNTDPLITFNFNEWPMIDPEVEENWIYKTSNQVVKKGDYKKVYCCKLKPGKTRKDFKAYMDQNLNKFAVRTIGLPLVSTTCYCPLNKEEYDEWFES